MSKHNTKYLVMGLNLPKYIAYYGHTVIPLSFCIFYKYIVGITCPTLFYIFFEGTIYLIVLLLQWKNNFPIYLHETHPDGTRVCEYTFNKI